MKIKNSPGRKNKRRKTALNQRKEELNKHKDNLSSCNNDKLKKRIKSKIKKAEEDISNLEEKIIPQDHARAIKTKKNRGK